MRRRRRSSFFQGLSQVSTGPAKFHSFTSIHSLVAQALGPSEMSPGARHSRTNDIDFTGGIAWKEAERMAVTGDLERARSLAPAIIKTANSVVTSAPRLDPVYKLDEGRWIDVARYVKGEPECWGDMVESEPAPRRGICVIVNTGVPGQVNAESVDRVGAEIGGAILGLQAMGNAVTLHFAKNWGQYSGNGRVVFHAPVNPGGAPLDTSILAAVCTSWFHRRIMFSLLETLDKETRDAFNVGGAYGCSEQLGRADAQRIAGSDTAIVLNVLKFLNNPGGVKDEILRQIKGA